MNTLKKNIEKIWYRKKSSCINSSLILLFSPLCYLFQIVSTIRRLIICKFTKTIPVPVVVVGNITVGGSGKTRLCLFLAQELIKQNQPVGIILRGYGGTNKLPKLVSQNDTPEIVGDEALIYARHGLQVVCGADRHAAAMHLLEKYPDTKIIISDDGLQHYKLSRNFEICVVDSIRMFGNGKILPCGPLREPISRLKTVNAVFIQAPSSTNITAEQNSINIIRTFNSNIFVQRFLFMGIINPVTRDDMPEIKNNKIYIISALGDNQRFLDYIKLSLHITHAIEYSFPDHYQYKEHDLPQDGIIITTEKDYVKMKQFNKNNIWLVESNLHIDNFHSIIAEIIKLGI